MAIDTQAALDAVAAALATGEELQDERKSLKRYSPSDMRDLFILQCELADPNSSPVGRILRPKRIKL